MDRHEKILIFCREIWSWYAQNKRRLPWRDLAVADPGHRAYLVLVSEIMLQQTQVPRVVEKYKLFVQRFPSMEALSNASNAEVLIAWKGMGYNSRALRLRDAAQVITGRFGGSFPTEMDELQSIKGIGEYTAGAIRNFAFGIPTPCIDTNIRRILHRFFVGPENPNGTWKKDDQYLMKIAAEILDVAVVFEKGNQRVQGNQRNRRLSLDSLGSFVSLDSSNWHSALMDFGSLVMTKSSPKWELLSKELRSVCSAYGKQISRTKKVNKKEPGIVLGGKFIPRRILRGKVIESLRGSREWMDVNQLRRSAGLSSAKEQKEWFHSLLLGLVKETLVQEKAGRYRLQT